MKPVVAGSRFKQLFVQIHSSFWFVPALIVVGMVLLAVGLVEMDRQFDDVLRKRWPRLFVAEAEGARSMLSAIAGSMATIAGVVFSITMVALALASNQYTSRVLRNFMRDRANQIVLGIFIGVHIYCLLVLREISGGDGAFVPAAAVLAALVLALLASGAFIFFVHHISATIQADEMAQSITNETLHMIDKLFPDQPGSGRTNPAGATVEGATWQPVPARNWGTVQTVDDAALIGFARRHDAVVRMECKPGDFVGLRQPIVSLSMTGTPDDDMVSELNQAYGVDAFRTIDQDPAFGIRQLVDMALKALSPGINDTTTAVTCLAHIGVILAYAGDRHLAPRHHFDGATLRLLRAGDDAARLVGLAFGQIAENAEGNTEVLLRILDTIAKVAAVVGAPPMRDAMRHQLGVVAEIARRSAKSQAATAQLEAKLQAVGALLAPSLRACTH